MLLFCILRMKNCQLEEQHENQNMNIQRSHDSKIKSWTRILESELDQVAESMYVNLSNAADKSIETERHYLCHYLNLGEIVCAYDVFVCGRK